MIAMRPNPAMPARRMLLVSYHYPPSEATGALRWQKLTTLAASFGWTVDVISLAPANAEGTDWRRVTELPPDTTIHGVAVQHPWQVELENTLLRAVRAVRAVRRRLRQTAAASPPRAGTLRREDLGWWAGGRGVVRAANVLSHQALDAAWCREAVETGLRAGRHAAPDLVLSCGPPHVVHEVGRRLAGALQVPFVIDMRDPWSLQVRLPEDLASPLWYRLAARHEARCVGAAGLVVMNTPKAAAEMQTRWPGVSVISVMNGWDDEPLPRAEWPAQFRIVFAGAIYIDRSPRPLFRAIARAVRELGVTPEEFEVRFIGSVATYGGAPIGQIAEEEGAGGFVQVLSSMPRQQVLHEYAQAAVLLSLPQDSHTAIPSKVFEYMRQPCWILAQNEQDSATGELLRGTSAGIVDPDDVVNTAAFLVGCYRAFRAGRRPLPAAMDDRASRVVEGSRLFRALGELIGGGRAGSSLPLPNAAPR